MIKKLYQDITFYVVIFILTYFIYIYPFEILNKFLFNEVFDRSNSLLSSLFISILIIFYFRSKNTFFLLKIFIYEGMGVGFISFIIVNIALIIKFFIDIDSYLLGISSIFLIFSIATIGFIYGQKIIKKELMILSNKIENESNFIFISDVHLGTNPISHLQKLLNKISKLDFNFILIGGDLIDSSSFNLNKLLILKKINKPIYFVTGNHEYYLKNHIEKLNRLKDYNIITLDNENIIINDINIIGVADNQKSDLQYNKFIELRDTRKFNLLLIHKPSIWEKSRKKVDLMLSGHCHNSQIIFFKILVRLQFKYIYGLHKYKKSNLYISSGVGCWGPRLRVGTINEFVHIKLKPYNQ